MYKTRYTVDTIFKKAQGMLVIIFFIFVTILWCFFKHDKCLSVCNVNDVFLLCVFLEIIQIFNKVMDKIKTKTK